MSDIEMKYCKPDNNVYVIIEELHHSLGVGGPTLNEKNLGLEIYKRARKIAQVCNVHDLYYDDQKIVGAPVAGNY